MINYKQKLLGFGLAEVLVGLAITGGVLITITSVGINASRQVKNNELSDKITNIMLQSVEYLKTPVSDLSKDPGRLLSEIVVGETRIYSILNTLDSDSGIFQLKYETGIDVTNAPITVCSTTNKFQAKFSETTNKFIICNKISITRVASGGYFIVSYIGYTNLFGTFIATDVKGYRQEL